MFLICYNKYNIQNIKNIFLLLRNHEWIHSRCDNNRNSKELWINVINSEKLEKRSMNYVIVQIRQSSENILNFK